MKDVVYTLGSVANEAAFASGLACISAAIIFTLLSLMGRRAEASPIRKSGLYYNVSVTLLLVGLYLILLSQIIKDGIKPDEALWFYRWAYFFGIPAVPIFLNVVLNLTIGPYKETLQSRRIQPFWKTVTRVLSWPMWVLCVLIWVTNAVDLFAGTDLLFEARNEAMAGSFVPHMPTVSSSIGGIKFFFGLWAIAVTSSFALMIAYMIRSIWFDKEYSKIEIEKEFTFKKVFAPRTREIFWNGIRDKDPPVKLIKSFSVLTVLFLLLLYIQGSIGYEWESSFPIVVYSAGFGFFAVTLILIGELVEAREQLVRAYTAGFGARMVGVVAHELGTPILLIRGLFERMEKDFRERIDEKKTIFKEKELEEYLVDLGEKREELDRIAKVIDDMKAKAGLYETHIRSVKLNELIQDVAMKENYPDRGKEFHIHTAIEERISEVWIDPEQMRTILRNLIENAIDALQDADGMIWISSTLELEKVTITVEDNGRGIPERDLDRIKEPFYTTKKRKGTGLGIPIVEGFLKEIDGKLEIESRVNGGTIAKVVFPHTPQRT